MRRSNNQDSLTCVPAKTEQRFTSHGHLFVVADGMGAHAAGELASQIATQHISQTYFHSTTANTETLRDALIDANREIHNKGQSNPEFHNMGTTASSLAISKAGAVVGHVGDSRVYRLRKNRLEQLTFDHSLVWEIEANPELDHSAWTGPIPKNVITRSLGPNSSVQVDLEGPFPVETGDCFLLCSDGLTGVVDDEEIGALLNCLSNADATQVLADLANLRGGPDNITAVVVSVDEAPEQQPAAPNAPPRGKRNRINPTLLCTTIGGLLLMTTLTGLAIGGQSTIWPIIIVLAVLGCIGVIACLIQMNLNRKDENLSLISFGGEAPYRSYDANPTNQLYDRLDETVQTLHDFAIEQNWMMDWTIVDNHRKAGKAALKSEGARVAIGSQAKAIIETMKQLREQHDRAADETSVDL